MGNEISGLNSINYVRNSNLSSNRNVQLSDELLEYLDNSGEEGKKLSKIVKKLVKDSNGDLTDGDNLSEISSKGKEFIKSYNKIIDYCRKNSDDEGLQSLAKKLKSITSNKKDEFSSLGITVQSYGKLKITDSVLYDNSVNNGSVGKFVASNSGKFTNMFDKITKIANSLHKDNTIFLDDNTLKKMDNYFYKKSENNLTSVSNNSDNSSLSSFSAYA